MRRVKISCVGVFKVDSGTNSTDINIKSWFSIYVYRYKISFKYIPRRRPDWFRPRPSTYGR